MTVAILAFNEAENIRTVIGEMKDELKHIAEPWEILIIDDGSSDGTSQIADDLCAQDPRVRVVHHGVNRGLGGGYRTGFENAKGTFLIFYPADGQFPPDIITRFYGQMGELDMLLGYLPNEKRPPLSRAASLIEQVLYRALVGKMPRFQGVLMFRTALLKSTPLLLDGRGWGVLLEFILRVSRGGYRIRSVPTTLRARMAGQSKVMNFRTIKANLTQLLELSVALRKTR